MRSQLSGAATATEAVVPRDHLIQEPQLKPLLLHHARRAWCTPGHPGWGFYTFQGRATSRMPPEGAARYAVDPNKIPCFTPSTYAEASDGAEAADGAADVAAPAAEVATSAAHFQQAGTHGSESGDGAHREARHSPMEGTVAAQQLHEGYTLEAVHAAQSAAAETVRQARAAELSDRAVAQQQAQTAAVAALFQAAAATAAGTAAPHEQAHSDRESHMAAATAVGAAMAHGVTASAWMNTHELAAAAAGRHTMSQGQPLSLFHPSAPADASGGIVRQRSHSEGPAAATKCARLGDGAGAAYPPESQYVCHLVSLTLSVVVLSRTVVFRLALCRVGEPSVPFRCIRIAAMRHACTSRPQALHAALLGLHICLRCTAFHAHTHAHSHRHVCRLTADTQAAAAGVSFLPLAGLSGDLQVSLTPGGSSVLVTRSTGAPSGDLGSFIFSNPDSLPAGTPRGSIELAV